MSFRAIPFIDTDVTRVFTHSYALFRGLAGWHWLFSSQFRKLALKLALRDKWVPVTTGEIVNYRRSIRSFQKFELRTRVIYWDENRIYAEQSFHVGGEMFVSALVEGALKGPQGVLKPAAVFAQVGYDGPSPEPSREMKERIASLKKSSPPGGAERNKAEQLASMSATVQPNQSSEEIDVTEFVRLGKLTIR